MYQNKIKLTPQEILEKSFKIDTRGYRLKEVDQFLDEIITDYEQFYRIINSIEQEKRKTPIFLFCCPFLLSFRCVVILLFRPNMQFPRRGNPHRRKTSAASVSCILPLRQKPVPRHRNLSLKEKLTEDDSRCPRA